MSGVNFGLLAAGRRCSWLPYVTGGFAWGHVRYTADDFQPTNSATGSATATGWTVGGGIEYAITQHWSVKAEYLHIDLGSKTIDALPAFTLRHLVSVKTTAEIGRFGVNYRF